MTALTIGKTVIDGCLVVLVFILGAGARGGLLGAPWKGLQYLRTYLARTYCM